MGMEMEMEMVRKLTDPPDGGCPDALGFSKHLWSLL